jgi:hypothetical protein
MGNDLLGLFAPLADIRGVVRWLMIGGIAFGLWLGLARSAFDPRTRVLTWAAVVLPLLAWHVVVWRFAAAGGFEVRMNLGGVVATAIPLAILLPPLIALPFVLRSTRIGAALDTLPPSWLVGFQVYRVLGSVFCCAGMPANCPACSRCPPGSATCWWARSRSRSRSICNPVRAAGVRRPTLGTFSASSIFWSRSASAP